METEFVSLLMKYSLPAITREPYLSVVISQLIEQAPALVKKVPNGKVISASLAATFVTISSYVAVLVVIAPELTKLPLHLLSC